MHRNKLRPLIKVYFRIRKANKPRVFSAKQFIWALISERF